jgi:hypothetical protein
MIIGTMGFSMKIQLSVYLLELIIGFPMVYHA